MKRINLPESVALVNGETVKLAPVALNKRFTQFMSLSTTSNDVSEIVEALRGVIGDCIKNGNAELSAEDAQAKLELMPLNVYIDVLGIDEHEQQS